FFCTRHCPYHPHVHPFPTRRSSDLKSVEGALGSQEYARLRIGVGPDDPARRPKKLADYVTNNFGKHEAKVVRELFPTLAELVETWLEGGPESAMNRFNKLGKATP